MKPKILSLLALLLIALGSNAQGGRHSFKEYLSYFPEWDENSITEDVFVNPISSDICDILGNDNIKSGYRVSTSKYIAVYYWKVAKFYDGQAMDYMLCTYTPKGKFIDSLACGRLTQPDCEIDEPWYYFHLTSSDSRSSFRATQYVSVDSCDLDKGESRWMATDYLIRIQENGKILRTKEKVYPTLVFGTCRRQYPESLFVGNKTIPLNEHWLVVPMEITKEEFMVLSEKSVNVQAEPVPYKDLEPSWKWRANRLVSRGVRKEPTQAFHYKQLGLTEIRFPWAYYMKSYMVPDNGQFDISVDSVLLDSESRAFSPIGVYAGEEGQDCDHYAPIVFYAYDKENQAMKPLFRYEDRRFFAEDGLKMFWINPRELIVAGYSQGNGVKWGDYVTKGLKPRGTPVYYKLRLVCLGYSHLQSILPEELQCENY